MKPTSARAEIEKLDEVKLSAPARSPSKTVAKSAEKPAEKSAESKAKKKAAAKPVAAAATKTAKAVAPTAEKHAAAKAEKAAPPQAQAKPEKANAKPAAKKKVAMPTIPLDVVRDELLLLAQKNGWLRSGLSLDVSGATLVYTTDKWATLHKLELTSIANDQKGFVLAGVQADVELEYVVNAALRLTKVGAKHVETVDSVWLNNRGRNYTMTVQSTAM
jgi:hypothetical protein